VPTAEEKKKKSAKLHKKGQREKTTWGMEESARPFVCFLEGKKKIRGTVVERGVGDLDE